MRGNRANIQVHVQARIPADVYEILSEIATTERPLCGVVRDAITAAVRDKSILISQDSIKIVEEAVTLAGYESVDSLIADLAKAYINTLRYYKGEITDDEPSPDIDIIEMFSDCNNPNKYEKNI